MLRLPCIALLLATALACVHGTDPSADADLPPDGAQAKVQPGDITPDTIFEHERYWPYRIKLSEAWRPESGERAFRVGTPGVLIRLIDADTALVDFAGLGVHEVPVSSTDIVESARGIVSGRVHHYGPNLLVALGPRLVDTRGEEPVAMRPEFMQQRLILLVFADPGDDRFDALAQELSSLPEAPAFSAVLLPQGGSSSQEVFERMREAGWPAPFLQPRLSPGYSEGLLPEGLALPAVTLNTRNGRLLYQDRWEAGAIDRIRSALEGHQAELGPPPGERAVTIR
jgi:hypothetical protein